MNLSLLKPSRRILRLSVVLSRGRWHHFPCSDHCRAKGIPYVANIDIKVFKHARFQSLIVDGSQGLVILNPTRKTLEKISGDQAGPPRKLQAAQKSSHLRGETVDGYEVRIFANSKIQKKWI